jgi:hypothetical protein
MNLRLTAAVAALILAGAAQQAQAAQAPLQVLKPHYISYTLEIDINRPAKDVWAKVGPYCAIKNWLPIVTTCVITEGEDGQVGAVRLVNGGNIEILVGRTDLSYTYSQPAREGVPYNVYHGTMEAKPVTATTSKLVYNLFYDNTMLADDAARATEQANRRLRFEDALKYMKLIAEGGVMPADAPKR